MSSNLLKRCLPGLLALFLLPAAPVFAEPFLSGSMQVNTGAFYGGLTEYVYEKGRSRELSRLEWEEHFVPYVEVNGELTLGNFFVDLNVLTAISVKSGMMRDYDYMLADSDARSHFSEHDAWFDKHLEIHPSVGYTFRLGNWSLSPSAGILLRHRKWSAEDGYAQYASAGQPWSDNVPEAKTNGVVLSYVEAIWFPIISLGASYRIGRFEPALLGSWYPYLNIETIDSHYIRRTVFYDTMRGGVGFLVDLSLTYHPASMEAMNFKFGLGFEGIYPYRGKTSIGSIGYDTGTIPSTQTKPQMKSELFWAYLGLTIYPEKMIRK